MRVGIFTESYEPVTNGVSVSVDTLRDELTLRGHEVFVFAPAYRGHTEEHERVCRVPSIHTVFMPDYPLPLPFARGAHRTFASLKLDVVHTQTPFLLGILGARWARGSGVPLVSTNHTLYTEYAHYAPVRPKALTRAFLVRLMRWYYSGCDALVVPSTPVEQILRSYGVKTRIEVIRTGVVPAAKIEPAEREAVRTAHGVQPGDFLLLYVGRIAREKNLRMLLSAFKIVLGAHPNSRLLLVGGGPALGETIRFAAELGIAGKTEFVGMLARRQIDPIYAAADAFAFPSTTETQGIAICEALSAGLPVVAVNAGGIPENVRPGADGFLTADDPREFADRITFLIEHEDDRRKMAAEAASDARDFSVERMVSDYERFYASVIASASPRAGAPPSFPPCQGGM